MQSFYLQQNVKDWYLKINKFLGTYRIYYLQKTAKILIFLFLLNAYIFLLRAKTLRITALGNIYLYTLKQSGRRKAQ